MDSNCAPFLADSHQILEGERYPASKAIASPLRVAVVGCGTIARQHHIPVLAGHPDVRLVSFVDQNIDAAGKLAQMYKVEQIVSDTRHLTPARVDAVLIATPPYHHADACIDCLERGIHVLVEKPMALTLRQAEAMVVAAEKAGKVLSVGLFRRLLPSSLWIRAALHSQVFGRPLSFDVEEGHVFNWPAVTLGGMRKDLAGGGVLIDTGSHTLDQLLSFFGGPADLLEYRDNALGGVESDCALRLRIYHQGQTVEGRLELSRTRELRNTFRIRCERATLELSTAERERVEVTLDGIKLTDPTQRLPRNCRFQAIWSAQPESTIHDAFRAEIDDWLQAIIRGKQPYLSGRSSLPVVGLIDECYRQRQSISEVWVEEGLAEHHAPSDGAPSQTLPLPGVSRAKRRGRILVTGAAGFVGCRAVEMLKYREGWDVRAMVHNPGSAGRLARLPVEMFLGDLRSRKDIERAVEGCEAVVHCAYGTAWGHPREIHAVTVTGTKMLAEAAQRAGVRRFIHISTVAIHGTHLGDVLDESTPIRTGSDIYAKTKARAEEAVSAVARRGLSAVILRLPNVYGPFSRPFTIRPVEHLLQGQPVLVGDGRTPSNTVYVDNVVEGIVCALRSPREAVDGEVFIISDGDVLSWRDYHQYYARLLDCEMKEVTLDELERMKAMSRKGLFSWIGSSFRGCKELFTSPECQAFGKKFLQTDPIGTLPRWVLEWSPRAKEWVRRRLQMSNPFVYQPFSQRMSTSPSVDLLELYARPARVSIDKAQRKLGYRPVVTRERAMDLTLEWLRYARFGSCGQ